jgi:hypothetical protein
MGPKIRGLTMSEAINLEGLLHEALSPIEPPEDLGKRLESTLMSITESAVEELEAWELSAMRDPRNWVRPATAALVGGSAGVALVLLRARHRPSRQAGALRGARQAAERAVSDLSEHTRRFLGDR